VRRPPFRRRRLSLTSLIDIIFLLLLFFMLSSTFSDFAEVQLAAAGAAPSGAPETPPIFVRLGAEALSVNARPVALAGLAEAMAPLIEAQPTRALVSVGPDVTAQRLTDLLVALRGVSGVQVQVLSPS